MITRGAEVDCVRLQEELAGVGGHDDQLVAGEVQEVLQHGWLSDRVGDGQYQVVPAILSCVWRIVLGIMDSTK